MKKNDSRLQHTLQGAAGGATVTIIVLFEIIELDFYIKMGAVMIAALITILLNGDNK